MITSQVGDNNINCGNIDPKPVVKEAATSYQTNTSAESEQTQEHHGFRFIISSFVGCDNTNCGNIKYRSSLGTTPQADTGTENEHAQGPRSFINTLVGNGNEDSGNIVN